MGKYELILSLCQEKGVKITNVEKELGFAKGSFKKMDSSKPSAEKIYAIARYFNVPMELFFDDAMGKAIGHYLDDEMPKRKIPLYEVAAGDGRINDGFPWYVDGTQDESEYSYCKIVGDSMFPTLQDGDVVRVHHQSETKPNDYTIVKVDGETATCKFVEITADGIWIRAENKSVFKDRFYTIQEVLTLPISIIGVVDSLQRSI